MAGRGPQSFKKRQKEQQRKEKQEEKRAKRLDRKRNPHLYVGTTDDDTPETDTTRIPTRIPARKRVRTEQELLRRTKVRLDDRIRFGGLPAGQQYPPVLIPRHGR
jgi:hypothetical protein